MRVRITTDNLLSNPKLELIKDGNTPQGWFTYVNGSAIKGEWTITDSQPLYYPNGLEYVDKEADFFENVTLYKGVKAKASSAGAIFNNVSTINNVLTTQYRSYLDVDTAEQDTQKRETTNYSKQIYVKEILTKLQIECTMMRKPNFSADGNRTLHVLKNEISKRLATTSNYTPVSMSLEFTDCNPKIKALATVFKTAIKYKAGFTLEAFLKPDDGEGWGGDTGFGGDSFWGGLDPNGQWVTLYHLDANNYALNRASTTGSISIGAILQKTELNSVS